LVAEGEAGHQMAAPDWIWLKDGFWLKVSNQKWCKIY
jgi:hypothetical protein